VTVDKSRREPHEHGQPHHPPPSNRRRQPYAWPYNGDLRPQNTALIVIDMQTDFCGVGGYVDKMGYDLSLTRAPIEPIKRCSRHMRAQGLPHHPHPRGPPARPGGPAGQQALALAPDRRRASATTAPAAASWCAASRAGRSSRARAAARASHHRQARQGLVLRHRPRTDPAHSAASQPVLTGITTDVCVHTTMREANDRGFECCCSRIAAPPPTTATTPPRSRW
jgi:nicotinamidase-related amidase